MFNSTLAPTNTFFGTITIKQNLMSHIIYFSWFLSPLKYALRNSSTLNYAHIYYHIFNIKTKITHITEISTTPAIAVGRKHFVIKNKILNQRVCCRLSAPSKRHMPLTFGQICKWVSHFCRRLFFLFLEICNLPYFCLSKFFFISWLSCNL